MVSDITSLTGNGLKDWLIQRVTAIGFAIYILFILGFFLTHPHMDYSQWKMLFQCKLFQIATILALVALVLHSWIGIWTVTTDYLKGTALRVSLQMVIAVLLLGELAFGIGIMWGQ